MLKIISLLIKAIIVAYLIIFAVTNSGQVELDLFFNDLIVSMPMFIFTLIVLFIGCVIGILSTLSYRFQVKRELKKVKRTLTEQMDENIKLRNITVSSTENIENVKLDENEAVKNQLR